MGQTHRHSLRPNRSDWQDNFADEYTVPVVLASLSIPKAIIKFGSEALASVKKKINYMTKGCHPVKYEEIYEKI